MHRDFLKVVLNLFACLLLVSCSRVISDNEMRVVRVDTINDDLSNLFSERIFTKQLQNPLNYVIGKMGKCIVSDSLLYILDKQKERICIFSIANGNAKGSISRLGRGPQEYLKITDFDIRDSKVFILSSMEKSVTEYDIDGTFITKVSTGNSSYQRLKAVAGNMVWLANEQCGDARYDYVQMNMNNGRITRHVMPSHKYSGEIRERAACFFEYNDSLWVSRQYDDIIYLMDKDGLARKMQFDFGGDNKVTRKDLASLSNSEIGEEYKEQSYLRYYSFFQKQKESCYAVASLIIDGLGPKEYLIKVDGGNVFCRRMADRLDDTYPEIESAQLIALNDTSAIFIHETSRAGIFNKRPEIGLTVDPEGNPIISMYRLR